MSCNCEVFKKAINTVRLLSADGIDKANSGHPGMAMGCADFAFTLWSEYLRFDPSDPTWQGRDRFVLSAGHGSMLLYSLMHLFHWGLTMEDLKSFRQWGSKCPGHPEYGHTAGVEVTTGPLASGLASAVGMAMGMKRFKASIGASDCLFDQKVYVISGDGCLMEGTSHEACALAGHFKLDNLIVFYDSNSISIEGSTGITMTENVGERFKAYGWNVLNIDGHSVRQIRAAIEMARVTKGMPTLIIGKTVIGKGAPKMAGSEETHGAPLPKDELAAAKVNLGFDPEQFFVVPEDVRAFCDKRVEDKKAAVAVWNKYFADFQNNLTAETRALMDALLKKEIPSTILEDMLKAQAEKPSATRASGGIALNVAANAIPAIMGGSADLGPSTKTYLKGTGFFGPEDWTGRNIHFGVRELGMGLIANGLALSGYAIPYCSTFMVFADYMKPALRLAALQGLHEIFIFSHDSIFVGEDGPTHQPIEQLFMFRSIPGLTVLRPADATETAHAWAYALKANGPVVLCLTRQNVPNLPKEVVANAAVEKGAYVLSSDSDYEAIVIATGSEVTTAFEACEALRKQGKKLRLVSMPSWELFEQQSAEYKESVLPSACDKRISVEAGLTMGWPKYVGFKGLMIGMEHFGASAPASRLAKEYGFTAESVAEKIADYLN